MSKVTHEPSEYKTVPYVQLKIEEDQGVVEHLISVFGVLDLGRDVCHPGSFTKTLSERANRIRVLDCHKRGSVLNVIGVPLEITEISRDELPPAVLEEYPEASGGVKARTQYLLDTPEGLGVFKRLKAGAVDEFSFAYDTLDADYTKGEDGKDVRNLRTIRLWEYSPVIFGMNPATAVLGVKEIDSEPEEEKPAPDVTENTIRIRLRNPNKFQEGSFRTIQIGKKSDGIKAVIGRLIGKTSTTVQSYIFDKTKWTAKKAQKWVKDHGGTKALSYTRVIDQIRTAFHSAYNPPEGPYSYWIKETFDEYIVVEAPDVSPSTYFRVDYTLDDDGVEFSPRGEWISGEYVFVAQKEPADTSQTETAVEIAMAQIEIELAMSGPDCSQ